MTRFGKYFSDLKNGFTGSFFSISLGPVGATKDVMLSPHDNNARENIGTVPFGKKGKGLGHFLQTKCHPLGVTREPIIIKNDGSPHLFKNGKLAGFTNYSAFPKLSRSATRQSDGRRAPPAEAQASPLERALAARNVLWEDRNSSGGELEEMGGELEEMGGAAAVAAAGLDSLKDRGDRDEWEFRRELRRDLVRETLLRELPGLDIEQFGKQDGQQIGPDNDQIERCKKRYEQRLQGLEDDLEKFAADNANPKLIANLEAEIEQCRECRAVLESALEKPKGDSFWRTNLLARWREHYPEVDLLARVRALRDLDAVVTEQSVSGRPEFFFLPQELCWLETEIAVAELLDIQQSHALAADQFVQLVQAIARGWPGVLEDSRSPLPERRANAAGCIRALARLANKGRLPREVLASSTEHDAINRALLIRGHEREMGGKYDELRQAQAELASLDIDISRQERMAAGGKGKEHEGDDTPEALRLERGLVQERIDTLNAEIEHVTDGFRSLRKSGRELGELYAELMVAERNLRAAGVNVRRVRVDEHFVKGMLKKQPGKRKKVALMLARVALIEEEIAKLNPHFQRRVPSSILTYREIGNRIDRQMAVDGVNPHETNAKHGNYQAWPLSKENRRVSANPAAFVDGLEIKKPHNPLAGVKLRHRKNALLRYGITDEDAREMKLPSTKHGNAPGARDKETLRKLANANVMSAGDVAFMHEAQQQVREHLVDTAAGRKALRSAFGMTTAQLSAEYLDMVFRWVTGDKGNFNLGHNSATVRRAMAARWDEVMGLTEETEELIRSSSDTIRKLRRRILDNITDLEVNRDDPEKLGEIEQAHATCLVVIQTICNTIGKERYHLLSTMIRAAILAARPQVLAGDQPKFEAIDSYDASRYRKEIDDILESWGMDEASRDLYGAIIDHLVYSRHEDSDKAPGTVTARRLARWQRQFKNGVQPAEPAKPGEIGKAVVPVEPPSRLERAGKTVMKAAQAVAGFMSDKESKDLDPEFVERIIASIPAISNYGKISIRTNMMVHGGFPFDTGHGVTIPLNLGGGRQVGLIIKRINGRVEVRLVFGFQLDGQIGVIGDGSKESGAGDGGFKLEGSLYETEGISAHFEIRYNPETGREDFSAVQAYVRSLLSGDLPSTEDVAGRMFNFQRITKSGQHVKPIGSASGSYGAASELADIGAISLAGTGSASGDHRWRWRQGGQKNANPQADKKIFKETSNTTVAASASFGLKLGYGKAAGSQISDLGAPVTKDKLVGFSAGKYRIKLKNRALYDLGRDYDWDWIKNIGPVTSVEKALEKCGAAAKAHIEKLLDQETTLQNGEKATFRDAVDQALKLLRTNDGFLLQWVPKPAARALVNRNLDRIAQINEQILPTLDSWTIRKQVWRKKKTLAATRMQNPKHLDREKIKEEIKTLERQRHDLDAQRRHFKRELRVLADEIAMRKNPDNLDYFDLEAIYIMPIVMQTDTKTVLDLAGLLNISHIGTRMHDTIIACIPAPKPKSGRLLADAELAKLADREAPVEQARPEPGPPPQLNAAELGVYEQIADDSSEDTVGGDRGAADVEWDESVAETPPPSPTSPPGSSSGTPERHVMLESNSSSSPDRAPLSRMPLWKPPKQREAKAKGSYERLVIHKGDSPSE